MNKVKYIFLIFILILAPAVQAINAVSYNSVESTVINKPNCHETKQSNTVKMNSDCECEDCHCGCLCSHITTIEPFSINSNLNIYHDTLVVFFNVAIPYQDSHPLFRPPIS